jgi:hypothetical protein
MPSPQTNQVYFLIAAHARAYAEFAAISDCIDETLAAQQGRKVSAADHALWEERSDVECKTRIALCALRTPNAVELRARAAYILAISTVQVELQHEDYDALLRSLAA